MQTPETLNNLVEMYNYGYKIPAIVEAYKTLYRINIGEIEEAFISILASAKTLFLFPRDIKNIIENEKSLRSKKLKKFNFDSENSKIVLIKPFKKLPKTTIRSNKLKLLLYHFREKTEISDIVDNTGIKPSTLHKWYRIMSEMKFNLKSEFNSLSGESVNIELLHHVVDTYNKHGLKIVLDTVDWNAYKEIILLLAASPNVTIEENKITSNLKKLPPKGVRYYKLKKLVDLRNEGLTSLEISEELGYEIDTTLKKIKFFHKFELC